MESNGAEITFIVSVVNYRVSGSILCVHLFAGDGNEGVHINQALLHKRVVSRSSKLEKTAPQKTLKGSLQPG